MSAFNVVQALRPAIQVGGGGGMPAAAPAVNPIQSTSSSTGASQVNLRGMNQSSYNLQIALASSKIAANRRKAIQDDETDEAAQDWRRKDRIKTISVALIICLNIGIDPPDVVKTVPCAKLECWIDPHGLPPAKALESIARNLQSQYEVWQPRARYKHALDPTMEELKKLCCTLRRNAKEERILFHYNGHGVPRPTPSGEIWVFNKSYTQYIPVALYDLQTWLGSPCVFVYDCSGAGNILQAFNRFAEQRDAEAQKLAAGHSGSNPLIIPTTPLKECIQLAACGPNEVLPMNPNLPADIFTACLTTPIEIALQWFVLNSPMLASVTIDHVMKLPGRLNDRRTPLGELNWIFTAITDTIAWNVLPRSLFKRLFRQDSLVAAFFRNFLLADRILRSQRCTPQSYPALPPTHQHPMWDAWDLAVDLCMSQLPVLLSAKEGAPDAPIYENSNFFFEQLTAFEVWLAQGNIAKKTPEQLPVVLQVLLSQAHRLRALKLLARFLSFGSWAVYQALSVGIFPYVLKLLQSPADELKPTLIQIWAYILAVDESCQNDLLKDAGYNYFISYIAQPVPTSTTSSSGGGITTTASPAADSTTIATTTTSAQSSTQPTSQTTIAFTSTSTISADEDATTRANAYFVLAKLCKGFRLGQIACLKANTIPLCLDALEKPHAKQRLWACLCLGQIWCDFTDAKWVGIRHNVSERLVGLLQDSDPLIRSAALFSIGTLIGGLDRTEQVINIEQTAAINCLVASNDASHIVRKQLVTTLSALVTENHPKFVHAAYELLEEERQNLLGPESSDSLSASPRHSSVPIAEHTAARPISTPGGIGERGGVAASPRAFSGTALPTSHSPQSWLSPANVSYSSSQQTADPIFWDPLSNPAVCMCIWKTLLNLSCDPNAEVASSAQHVVDAVTELLLRSPFGSSASKIWYQLNDAVYEKTSGGLKPQFYAGGHQCFATKHRVDVVLRQGGALIGTFRQEAGCTADGPAFKAFFKFYCLTAESVQYVVWLAVADERIVCVADKFCEQYSVREKGYFLRDDLGWPTGSVDKIPREPRQS